MCGQLVVGLGGLPGELLAWCFGLLLAHLPMVARPGFCRDGSQTVTSHLTTVVPPICADVGLAPIKTKAVQIWESCA